jgi:hypothetical protein
MDVTLIGFINRLIIGETALLKIMILIEALTKNCERNRKKYQRKSTTENFGMEETKKLS